MVLFNEVEIVLELLGVAAAGQFVARKLLFAKDRDQTVDQIKYALLLMQCNMPKNGSSAFYLAGTVSGRIKHQPLAVSSLCHHCATQDHLGSSCTSYNA